MNIISCLGKRRPFLTHGIKGILKIWFVPQSSTLKVDFNKHDSAEFFMCNARSDCFGIPISFWQSFNSQMYTSRLLWIQSFLLFPCYTIIWTTYDTSPRLYIYIPLLLGGKRKKKHMSVLYSWEVFYVYVLVFLFIPSSLIFFHTSKILGKSHSKRLRCACAYVFSLLV